MLVKNAAMTFHADEAEVPGEAWGPVFLKCSSGILLYGQTSWNLSILNPVLLVP